MQGLFTGTAGVDIDAGGWIESFPTRSSRVSRMDQKPGVLPAEGLDEDWLASTFLVQTVLVK